MGRVIAPCFFILIKLDVLKRTYVRVRRIASNCIVKGYAFTSIRLTLTQIGVDNGRTL